MGRKPHIIEIVIAEDGTLTSEVIGIEGQECTNITKWLDELGEVEVDKHTSDFYKTPKQTVKIGGK
jgi:hypothetical protein